MDIRTTDNRKSVPRTGIGSSISTNAVSSNIEPDSEENLAKRRKIDQDDMKIALEMAQEEVNSANKRNVKVGARCSVESENRKFMQKVFSVGGKLEGVVADGMKIKGKNLY